MLHKVSLEVTPPGAYGIATSDGRTDLPCHFSPLLAQTSQWTPSPPLQRSHMQSQQAPFPEQPLPTIHLSGDKSILIVDDSPTVRKILETGLTREGFQVTCFGDGIAAMQWLFQSGATLPALIILDINLPKMNGYEVARYLKMKPALKNTILIMLTRHDGVIDRVKGRLAGAQAYLSKPFEIQTIITVVESYLGVPSQ